MVPSLQYSGCTAVQVALEEDGGCHFVHDLFAILPPNIALDQHAVGLGGGEAFVPGSNRDLHTFTQSIDEYTHFFGCRPVAAVHVSWHSNDDLIHLLFLKQRQHSFQKPIKRFGWNILQRRGDHLELVAQSHSNTNGPVIQSQYAHPVIASKPGLQGNANFAFMELDADGRAFKHGAMKSSLGVFTLILAFCAGSVLSASAERDKDLQRQVQEALKMLKERDSSFEKALDKAHGCVIFPNVGKGGFIIGGAGGAGEVYQGKKLIGTAKLSQATIGAQIGGQTFIEAILFSDRIALNDFKKGKFEMSAGVSAVAAAEGVAGKSDYEHGMAVIILPKKGLMAEASIGGQKFDYKPLEEKD